MTTWLDKLNLQPQERRGVLLGLVLVALVFNYWFIWPYFSDWSKVSQKLEKQEELCARYLKEIGKAPSYKTKLAELERTGEGGVLEEEQANRVQSTITSEAFNHNVTPSRMNTSRSFGPTNAFFNEEVAVVDVVGGESDLIEFLHALGSGDSMIRVRDMNNLGLDPSQQKLMAKLTLVASFQKKVVTPPPTQVPRTSSPVVTNDAAKPTTAGKTNGVAKPSINAKTNIVTAPKNGVGTNRLSGTDVPPKKK